MTKTRTRKKKSLVGYAPDFKCTYLHWRRWCGDTSILTADFKFYWHIFKDKRKANAIQKGKIKKVRITVEEL